MSEIVPDGGREKPRFDMYFYDGWIRRQLHEFGASGFKFYDEVLRRMDYGHGDIVLDIGAGMGHDGMTIAWSYAPSIIYLLEPPTPDVEDFDAKFLQIGEEMRRRGVVGAELLPTGMLSATIEAMIAPGSPLIIKGRSFIQPVPALAENIPLPDNSVSMLSMIHSAYEFTDLEQALSEVLRVMAPGAKGVLVTNGPSDKIVFKQILRDAAALLEDWAPAGVTYAAPNTVSSKLDYSAALTALSRHFEIIPPYRDRDDLIF